jgi:hypothetical protein
VRRRRTDARVLGRFWRGLEKPRARRRSGEEERKMILALGVAEFPLHFAFFWIFARLLRAVFMGPTCQWRLRLGFQGTEAVFFSCLTSQGRHGQRARFVRWAYMGLIGFSDATHQLNE